MDYADLLLDAICIVDAEGRFVSASAACERIFGYTPAELVGLPMLDMVLEEDRERTRAAAKQVMQGGSQTHFENRYRRKDGQIVHIMWTATWSEADQVRVGVARDVTPLKQAQKRQAAVYAISEAAHASGDLQDLSARIHAIISTLMPAENFVVALHDADSDELSFAYHVDARHPAPASARLSADTFCGQVILGGREILLTPQADASTLLHHAADWDGKHSWLGVPLQSSKGTIGALVVKSYSDSQHYGENERELLQFVSTQVAHAIVRKRLFQRLEYMAQYDPLTGLANRVLFYERLRLALLSAAAGDSGLAVLYLDLNGFKSVNDTYGHALGDTLLKLVARRLRHSVRASSVVARFGGDEFVVLLEELRSPAHAASVAAAIRAGLAQPFDVDGQCLSLGTSIGIAVYPQDGESAEELLQRADQAMYAQKNEGRVQATPVFGAGRWR